MDSFSIDTDEAGDRGSERDAEIERARQAIFLGGRQLPGISRELETAFLAQIIEIRALCIRDGIPASFAWAFVEAISKPIIDAMKLDYRDEETWSSVRGRLLSYLGVTDDG